MLSPLLAIILGTTLILGTVYAQNNVPPVPAEQDTLDIPPPSGDQAQPQAQPKEDVDMPPPVPPPQPFRPSMPEPGTAPVKTTSDAPFMQNQDGQTEQQQDGFVDQEDELDWETDEADSNEQPEDMEQRLEDEFARRMMELNEEVLNREYYPVFIYEDRDRRDPFMPILQSRQSLDRRGGGPSGLLQYDLTQLTLTAIAWNTKEPKALIRDPKSNVYTVKKRDPIGRNNGYVEDIREGEIIVIESRSVKGGQKFYSTQILRVGR